MAAQHHLAIPATVDGLGQAVTAISALAREHRASPRGCFAIELVVEELVGNVIRHAHPGRGGDWSIDLEFELSGDLLRVVIEDDGIAFDPLGAPVPDRPTTAADVPLGGRGIMMVRRVASELQYERRAGRNRLTVWVPLHPQAGPRQG